MATAVHGGIRSSLVFAPTSRPVATGPSRLWPVLAAVALHAILIGAYVVALGGDVSALVCVRRAWVGEGPFTHVTTAISEGGYDGQFCYVLARAPWQAHTEYLDLPVYRHVRLLYPALAWALTGGDPRGLLWALPLLNLLAVAGLAWLGVVVATHYGRSPWWGLVLPIGVNAGMSLLRDLTDPLAALTACGVLACWLLRWRPWVLAVWALAALLCREQNAAVVAVVALAALTRRDWSRAAAATAAGLLWVGWVVVLRQVYGAWPFSPDNVALPLEGLTYRWTHLAAGAHRWSAYLHAAGLGLLTLQIAACLALVFGRRHRVVVLVGLAGVVLALVGGTAIYADYNSYLRVFVWLPVALWFWAVQSGQRWPALLLLPVGLWPCLAVLRAWQG